MHSYVVIDVREPDEYADGHVDGALNITPADLMRGAAQLHDVPKEADTIVYCRSGNRSNVAMQILTQLGYHNVVNGINKDQVAAKYGL